MFTPSIHIRRCTRSARRRTVGGGLRLKRQIIASLPFTPGCSHIPFTPAFSHFHAHTTIHTFIQTAGSRSTRHCSVTARWLWPSTPRTTAAPCTPPFTHPFIQHTSIHTTIHTPLPVFSQAQGVQEVTDAQDDCSIPPFATPSLRNTSILTAMHTSMYTQAQGNRSLTGPWPSTRRATAAPIHPPHSHNCSP